MKVFAVILIVLGIAAAVVPQFYDCQSQGRYLTLANGKQTSMKCHWTARAEIALGVPIAAVGAMLAFNRRRESVRALTSLGISLGVFVILLPTVLIGVCASSEMTCNMIMKPALISMGGLVIVASLVTLAFSEFVKNNYDPR